MNHDIREQLGAKGNDLYDYIRLVSLLDQIYETEKTAAQHTNGLILAKTSWYRRHWESKEVQKDREKEPPSLLERLKIRKAKLAAMQQQQGQRQLQEEEAAAVA